MTTKAATVQAAGEAWSSQRDAQALGDYVETALKEKGLNRGAHDYVYSALQWMGVSEEGENSAEDAGAVGAFSHLAAQADAVRRAVEYLRLAAEGDPVRGRALVFSGPPASGSEAIWNRIVESVEGYSRSDEGRVYAISGCPVAENPLNLIEPGYRNEMIDAGSLRWGEGRLCPDCRVRFENELGSGKLMDIGVRRVVLGPNEGAGAALLSGEVAGSDVRAAAAQSNRGLLVFEGLTSSAREVVESVLELASRRSFGGRKGQTRWDGVVIASVDGQAFEQMCAEPSFAQARLRAHVVPTPYSLSRDVEAGIYETYRGEHSVLSGKKFSPLTIQAVARLAVVTRTDPPAASQGMAGLGPGRSLNALEDCALNAGVSCVTPLRALSELADYAEVEPEQVAEVVSAYTAAAVEVLRRAATIGFEEKAHDLLANYRNKLLRQLNPPEGANPSVEEGARDLRLMEDAVRVKDEDREAFRAEMGAYFERNPDGLYTEEPRMKEAIETRLLHPLGAILKRLREVAEDSPGRDGWARERGAVHDRLTNNAYGFCDVCAIDLVSMLLATERPVRVKKGELLWEWDVGFDAGDAKKELQKFRTALSNPEAQEAGNRC